MEHQALQVMTVTVIRIGEETGTGTETYQTPGSIDPCAAHIGAIQPLRPLELPEPLF
jgi:hypothetical protein